MYTSLYVKTNYSLLSSLITIDDYINYAIKNNLTSLVITDSNMFGTMEFYKKCKSNNIKPIIGLEVVIDTGTILLYAKDYSGYQSLIKLSTISSTRTITIDDLKLNNKDVISIILFENKELYNELNSIYTDIYLSYSNKKEELEASVITKNIVFVRKSLYINSKESEYLKYLFMIRDGKTIADSVDYSIKNFELNISDIYELTSNINLFTTNKIADMCNLEFPKAQVLLPIFSETNSLSSFEYLKELSSFGLNKRFNGKVRESYIKRLNYELDIINKMGFSNYFLVVYDFIKYAKKNNILVGPGRGSGAGSLVCYSLGITDIDPIKYDLLFERFLNPERVTMPDIDTDFPDIYRDKVIDYVVSKYGSKRVSGIVTFGTLASKQALRDVARVLNVPSYQIDLVNKRIPGFTKEKLNDFYNKDNEFRKLIDSSEKLTLMYKIASFIEGYPRHTSSHAAGIVMCQKDLDEVIPLTNSDGMYLTGFTMEHLEELGLLKMDFLGLKTLTTIMNIISSIEEGENIKIDFNSIPLDDVKVLELFASADTTGIFQFESDGMRNFLRKLKPNTFEDIFAAIALFRPGPAQNIDSYINRKHGLEPITYLDKSIESILSDTYGIIIYQEQIIRIANVYAGYTLGEADVLRRAMSKKKMDVLAREEEKFINKSIEMGHDYETSKKIFDLILSFANYGFNRSHSVAYSMVAYKLAYLKYHYPKYFYCSLLSSVIGSEEKTNEYIRETRSKNINILKPSINNSTCSYKVHDNGIYYPLSGIKGIGVVNCNEIINNRKDGYKDIFDFLSKVPSINKKVLEYLIEAGCFDEFGLSRKTYLDNLDALINYSELVKDLDSEFVLKPELDIKEEYTNEELIYMEKEVFGLYLSNHPTTLYKAKYNNIVPLNNISNCFNKVIDTIILVESVKTIKTKKGDDMMFVTGSDDYSKMEYTLFPKVYSDNSNISTGDILLINGKVERRYDTYQIIVNSIKKIN